MCACACVREHVCVCVHACVQACGRAGGRVCMYVCGCACVCACVHMFLCGPGAFEGVEATLSASTPSTLTASSVQGMCFC